MQNLIKRLGFKNVTEFYQKIADGALDVNETLDKYVEQQKRDNDTHDEIIYRSAEGYNLQAAQEESTSKEDVLVIDQNLKGLEFKLAKCCNPIYGDDVFGFVTVSGGIKIHRADCPNAFTVRSFLIRASRCPVSPTMTVNVPENNPSLESIPIERSVIPFSLEMIEVIFVTIPISSCPTTF